MGSICGHGTGGGAKTAGATCGPGVLGDSEDVIAVVGGARNDPDMQGIGIAGECMETVGTLGTGETALKVAEAIFSAGTVVFRAVLVWGAGTPV